jgi:hypothetical protein
MAIADPTKAVGHRTAQASGFEPVRPDQARPPIALHPGRPSLADYWQDATLQTKTRAPARRASMRSDIAALVVGQLKGSQ